MVGAVGALAVAGAYRPWLTRWPWSLVNALSSAIASEFPSALLGVHAAATVGALRSRGLSRVAGVALNGAVLAGLAGLAGDAGRSARVLHDALGELGVRGDGVPARRPRGVLPGPLARSRYLRHADVAFHAELGGFGTLDVWHRPGLLADGKAPVLVQVHGGAWERMDKRGQAEPLMGYLAERGWVCVTVNYRLAPEARWPAMIVDVKRAIAWTRENIAQFGGDPDFIAITGGSAGGHLAALAALSANDPDYQPGFTDQDTRVAAAVPLYGVHDFTADAREGLTHLLENTVIGTRFADDERTWLRASPITRVDADAPPFLVVHGTTDAVVPVRQSRKLVAALRADSPSPVGYAELPHAQHGFDFVATARTAYLADAVHRFLSHVHRGYLAGSDTASGRNRAEAGAAG